MGNKAKRTRVAAMLKERGLGPLYTCNKRRAYRHLDSWYLDNLVRLLKVKPGDMLNDCDGFNHVVVKSHPRRFFSGLIDFDQFEFEGGRWSCGCPGGPQDPQSREWIEKFHLEYLRWSKKEGSWFPKNGQALLDLLERGEHIVDERGIMLPELQERVEASAWVGPITQSP